MNEIQVTVRSGIPGGSDYSIPDGHPYPSTTTDFVKLLREQGVDVSYQHEKVDRRLVSLNAAEVWLPILAFVTDVGVNVPANIVASVILNWFGGRRDKAEKALLHVEYEVLGPGGASKRFKASGPGSQVLSAMERFGKSDE